MGRANLVVKFRLASTGDLQIKGVTRIKVDGRGSLIFYEGYNDSPESIDLGQLHSLTLHTLDRAVGQPN